MQIIPFSIEPAQQAIDSINADAGMLAVQGKTSAAVKKSGNPFAALIEKAENATEMPAPQPGASLRSVLLQKGKSGTAPDLRDTKLTMQDFESIKGPLRKLGVPKEVLKSLENGVDAGELTWNGLLGSLAQLPNFRPSVGVAQKLTDADKNNVTAFMQKIGMTTGEVKQTLTNLENGSLAPAWQTIKDKLAKIPAEQKITISASDASGLAKAMQLDKESTAKLTSLFNKLDGQELTPKQLSSALAEISTSVQQRLQKSENRFSNLRDALKPAMEQAWERSSHLEAADARASNETQASLTLMKDEVTAKANGFSQTADSHAGNRDVTREARSVVENFAFKPSAQASADSSGKNPATTAENTNLQSNQQGKNAASFSANTDGKNGSFSQQSNSGSHSSGSDSSGTKQSGNNDMWNNMLGKIALLDGPPQFASTASATSNAQTTANLPDLQQRVFDQVQNGMLRTLKNGGKQMTLKLNPEELGSVTVILSVRNKEVNAIIKPENAEATRAINEQISQLKQTLENQGLKVDRLEVRQELQHQGGDRQNWQGTNQHNFTQEQAQKFLHQRRLDSIRAEGEDLARDMRKGMQRATSSAHTGLSIIA